MKRVGIVELGTTESKMLIVDVLENQTFVTVEKQENKFRLAQEIAVDELIKQQTIFNVISILKTYKATLSSYEVVEIYAVASSEYANAKNQRSFFEEVYSVTGLKFKILTTAEENRFLYLSFINTLDCPKGIILNISGTQSHYVAYNRRNFICQDSYALGAVNLAQNHLSGDESPEKAMQKMTKEFASQVKVEECFAELDEETKIVGTGDVFLSIAKLSKKLKKYPYSRDHGYQFTKEDLDEVYDFVKTLDIDKTKKLKGISSQSADVLASGISIVKAFSEKTNIQKFIVSENGFGEGYLLSKVNPTTLEKPLSDVLGTSLETINSYYQYSSLNNTKNVYELSLILFKQLKVIHKLSRNYAKVLRIASFMHDCGKRINSNNYEKKGFNVVLDSEIYGVAHHEQVLAAFVVASQNLSDFSMTDWVKFSSILNEEDLEGARKLAVIVKLATKLDAFASGKILDISCDILGDSVIMKTITEMPADMEILESQKVASDFAKAFKKHLEVL